jgi:hypothetical protein
VVAASGLDLDDARVGELADLGRLQAGTPPDVRDALGRHLRPAADGWKELAVELEERLHLVARGLGVGPDEGLDDLEGQKAFCCSSLMSFTRSTMTRRTRRRFRSDVRCGNRHLANVEANRLAADAGRPLEVLHLHLTRHEIFLRRPRFGPSIPCPIAATAATSARRASYASATRSSSSPIACTSALAYPRMPIFS